MSSTESNTVEHLSRHTTAETHAQRARMGSWRQARTALTYNHQHD